MRTIELATHLVKVVDSDRDATVLCEVHKDAFIDTLTAMGQDLDVYQIAEDEDPISCQACHLAAMRLSTTTLQ